MSAAQCCENYEPVEKVLRPRFACCEDTLRIANFDSVDFWSKSCEPKNISSDFCDLLWELSDKVVYFHRGVDRCILCLRCNVLFTLRYYDWSEWKSKTVTLLHLEDDEILCERLLVAHHAWNCNPLTTDYDRFHRNFFLCELIAYARTSLLKVFSNPQNKGSSFVACGSCGCCISVTQDAFTETLCDSLLGWRWEKGQIFDPLKHDAVQVLFRKQEQMLTIDCENANFSFAHVKLVKLQRLYKTLLCFPAPIKLSRA